MERLEKSYYPHIVPGPTPSWGFDIDIFDLILAPITRYEHLYDISEIYACDIFFVPPTCDLTIFLRDHHNTCLIVTDSSDTEDDSIGFIQGMDLFEYDLAIDELELEFIYSCRSRHINESISWYTDMLDCTHCLELKLSYIVPCLHILKSLGVWLEYPDAIPIEYIGI
jgi:hypothetical protein